MKFWRPVPLLLFAILAVPAMAAQPNDKNLYAFEEILGITGMSVVQLQRVMPGTPAEALGIHQGDLLVAFDEKDMRKEFAGDWKKFTSEFRAKALMNNAKLEIYRLQADDSYLLQEISVHIHTVRSDPTARYFAGPSNFGYLVLSVTPGGLGDNIGLKPNDFLKQVGGTDVANMSGMVKLAQTFDDIASGPDPKVLLVFGKWEQTDYSKKEDKETQAREVDLKRAP